jgi:hypothetical protein
VSIVETLGWTWGERIEVEWSTGEILSATASPLSTRPDVVTVGQAVRIVLMFSADLPLGEPVLLWVYDGQRQISIRISA